MLAGGLSGMAAGVGKRILGKDWILHRAGLARARRLRLDRRRAWSQILQAKAAK